MPYSEKYLNKIAAPAFSSANIRKEPSISSEVILNRKNDVVTAGYVASCGRTTGDYVTDGDQIWYKLTLTKAVNGQTWGWARNDVVKLYTPKPESEKVTDVDAQNIVNKLVASDVEVHATLMRIAPLIESAKKKGSTIDKYERIYGEILEKLTDRQEKIKTSKLVKWNEGIKKGYEKLKSGFKTFLSVNFGINGIEIGSITLIVVGAVVGVGLAAGAYFAFRSDYDESTQNLKVSKELEKALANLTPEEAKKVMTDLEGQIDDAAKQGYTDAKFDDLFKVGKYILLAGAVYFVVTKVISAKNKK